MWWAPLAFVVLALLLLFITPIAVERRVAPIRDALTNHSVPARVALNDLEAAFASQLLVRSHEISPNDTAAVATREHLDADERELARLVPEISPEAASRFDNLSSLVRAWLDTTGARNAVHARDVFATAEYLDSYLFELSNTQRADARRYEQYNVLAAAILAPIALVAIVFVMWAGGRVQSFARAAAAERAEVLRAADARAALLRGVTHDVKNPLGAAAGYAQLLEEGVVGPLDDPQKDIVRRIHRLVNMSVETVTDLLELARADAGGLHVEYEETDLARLAGEVVDDHRGMARERQLEVELAATPTPLVTDPMRVRQVLSNLLSNAIKYTPPGGSVAISIVHDAEAPHDGRVGVEVRDTGPGIPSDLRSHVFEEFFRVRQAESATRGNGLGLAISRRIARLLGGDVTFRDAETHGAVFTLWLESGARARGTPPTKPPTETDPQDRSLTL